MPELFGNTALAISDLEITSFAPISDETFESLAEVWLTCPLRNIMQGW